MTQFDYVENWLNSVAYSHSQSKATEEQYKRVWSRFTDYLGKDAQEIVKEYESMQERFFKRKYAQYIKGWIVQLQKENLTKTSIKVMVGAVKSFFKYNDLPLGMIPQAMNDVVYHNRDITKDEIAQIMSISKIREKAFYALMTQSGLRPHTIKQLKIKNLEPLETIPCKIDIPKDIAKGKYGSYITFIGKDATKYLKQYLATRANLTPESLVFCSHDDSNKPVNVKDISRAFRLSARKLEETGAIHFKVRKGKPSELRLYNLRKFFRKNAIQMGFEIVEYMMGHTVKGVDGNYRPQDPEYYREIYAEKAIPFLRIETATPTESEKQITELRKELEIKDEEIAELRKSVEKIQKMTEFLENISPEHMTEFFRYRMENKQSVMEPPASRIEIPLTEDFNKRLKALMAKKEKQNEEVISISELIELSKKSKRTKKF